MSRRSSPAFAIGGLPPWGEQWDRVLRARRAMVPPCVNCGAARGKLCQAFCPGGEDSAQRTVQHGDDWKLFAAEVAGEAAR